MSMSVNFICGISAFFLLETFNCAQIAKMFMESYSKCEYPEAVRIGTAIVKRETEITKLPKLNAKSHFCGIPSKRIDRLCRACIEIHQSVFNEFKFNMVKDVSAGKCALHSAQYGAQNENLAAVYVRKCPIEPPIFISQGNKNGWIILFIPHGKPGQLQTAVHLGPFDSLLSNKRIISKYLSRPMKVPSI